MKICPISNNIPKYNLNKTTTNCNQLTKSKADFFAFCGTKVPKNELDKFYRDVTFIKAEAQSHQTEAQEVLDDSYRELSLAKDYYMEALQYINLAKKNKTFQDIELPNGNILSFHLQFKNNIATLEISEKTDENELVKTISAKNFTPCEISIFHDNTFDEYMYEQNNVTISKDVGLAEDNLGSTSAVYNFFDGFLTTANINGQVSTTPKTFEKMFQFIENKLFVYSEDIEMHDEKRCVCATHFLYNAKGQLVNYFENYRAKLLFHQMAWDQGCHFDNGSLIAVTNDVYQPEGKEYLVSDNACYKKDGEMYHTNKFNLLVSDFESIIYEDAE